MLKELLILGKFVGKSNDGTPLYNVECVRLVHDEKNGNKIYKNFVNQKPVNYLVRISKQEYDLIELGDIYSYSTTTDEYEKVVYVLGKLRKNIFGK